MHWSCATFCTSTSIIPNASLLVQMAIPAIHGRGMCSSGVISWPGASNIAGKRSNVSWNKDRLITRSRQMQGVGEQASGGRSRNDAAVAPILGAQNLGGDFTPTIRTAYFTMAPEWPTIVPHCASPRRWTTRNFARRWKHVKTRTADSVGVTPLGHWRNGVHS